MNLSSFIARRYLVAKKSHNVINIISIISALGIAVGCAALVVILSIYNGFDSIVRSLYNSYTPDLVITPAQGKVFPADSTVFQRIKSDERVAYFCEVLQENVFLQYGDNNLVATAKGVDTLYKEATTIKDYLVEGSFELYSGSVPQVVLGRALAAELQLHTRFLLPVEVYFPSRTSEVSLVDPLSSLRKEKLFPSGIVAVEQSFDKKYIFMPLLSLRTLLEYEGKEVSSIEIFVKEPSAAKSLQKDVQAVLSEGFVVLNKQQQNPSLNRLLIYEKLAIYLILLFVILIISCNILSSLTMLRIEKEADVEILKSMGATPALIKSIFTKQGWLISLCGIVVGIGVGLLICFLQQHFGIVKMPGNFIIDAYPVQVQLSDVLITLFGVGAICYFISRLVR